MVPACLSSITASLLLQLEDAVVGLIERLGGNKQVVAAESVGVL